MTLRRTDLTFGAFRLDVQEARLWQGSTAHSLTPKAFALLEFMARRPDKLVRKDELLDALWPDAIVGDSVLKVTIRELRKVLGDDARSPSYIATVHRRGYRFVADVGGLDEEEHTAADGLEVGEPVIDGPSAASPAARREEPGVAKITPASQILVGRERARAELSGRLAEVRGGAARMLFVTGGPGLGKTALVDDFVAGIAHEPVRVGRGYCVEHYGEGEAYLPVLQALSAICRDGLDKELLGIIAKHAPTWILQLPSLLERVGADALRRDTLGATSDRMLREFVDLLEVISAREALVLVLEDLHWCDLATLEVLSMVARKCRSARLMVVGTYRKTDVEAGDARRRRLLLALLAQTGVDEYTLEELAAHEVRAFLEQRFDGAAFADELALVLAQRTGGHPLFLTQAARTSPAAASSTKAAMAPL